MPRKKLKDTEFAKRWRSESPELFKKLQWLGGTLVGLSPFMLLTPFTAPLSPILFTGGTVLGLVSKLPVKGISLKDAEKIKEESEKLKQEIEKLSKKK